MDMDDFKLDSKNRISPGFKTPDDYFNALPEKVLQRLPQHEPKVIPLWERRKKWLYGTAAVVVLSLGIPVVDYLKSDANEPFAAEVENYLTQHSTITDDDIIELLSNEDVEALNINTSPESPELEDILTDNAYLEEYITN